MPNGEDTVTLSDETTTVDNNTQAKGTDHIGGEVSDHLSTTDNNGGGGGGGGSGGSRPSPPPLGDGSGGGNFTPSSPPSGGGGGGGGGGVPIKESKEVIVSSSSSTGDPTLIDQESLGGGSGGGLIFPLLTGKPFGAGDLAMKGLDTSGYRMKRRAAKASGLYDQVSKTVQTRIGFLVGVASEISAVHADIDAAASKHIASLGASKDILAGHISTARGALSERSSVATGQVTAAIGAERGAIQDAAKAARGKVDTAANTMKSAMGGAHQQALGILSGGFDKASGAMIEGMNAYGARISERLSAAKELLVIPGKDAQWTCAHYRVRQSLGAQFGSDSQLFKNLRELGNLQDHAMLEAYGDNIAELDRLKRQGAAAADAARRSGRAQISSFEKSALGALDETEQKVIGNINTATEAANASLDTIAQERSEGIGQATVQTATDAAGLKVSAEAALWADAENQGEALVATAEAAAAPLRDKPRQKFADAAISAVSAVKLDTTAASAVASKMVAKWAGGHAKVRAALDGSADNAAQGWTKDAVKRVADAEHRSLDSVTKTSQGSRDGIAAQGDSLVNQLKANTSQAAEQIKRKASKLGGQLKADTDSFILGLEVHEALDTTALSNVLALADSSWQALCTDFAGRAEDAHAAMFDPGLLEGTDETKLYTALRGVGGYGADALAQSYKEHCGRDLYADIYSELDDEENAIASAYLADEDAKGIQLEVEYYKDGFWGADEEAITELLKAVTPDQLAALEDLDEWRETEKELYTALEGDDLNLRVIQSLIAGNKSRAEALELIGKITEARWNEDEDALRDAIEGIPADSRAEVLAQFAVLQELAGRDGGLDVVDFTLAEVDEELLDEMQQAATDEDGNPIVSTNDDLTERDVTKGEQAFSEWVTKDKLAGDDLYTEGGPGFTDVLTTSIMLAPLSPVFTPLAYDLEKSEITNSHVLDDAFKDMIGDKALHGSTSLEGRAAGFHYEMTENEDVEAAYKELEYTHTDEEGNRTNSSFQDDDQRETVHEEWSEAFDKIYQEQHGTTVSSDISGSDLSDKEKELLDETRKGGTGSAETMLEYAQDGWGTYEWSAEKAFEGASREDIDAYFVANPGARERLLSEFSGDEYEKMQILMIGKVETDLQRWEIAKIRYDFVRGSGAGDLNIALAAAMGPAGGPLMMPGAPEVSANHFWDLISGSGQVMDLNYEKMKAMIDARGGEETAFGADGMLIVLEGDGQERDIEQLQEFRDSSVVLEKAEETYKASTDAYTDLIATVAGIVAGAALTILTAGAAAPAAVALISGLTTMATKAALKGDRYGWEEMAQDSALLAVEVATASLASKITKVTKAADAAKTGKIVPVSGADFAKYELPKNIELGLKAGEAFVSNTGKTLVSEETYDKGALEGTFKAFKDGLKGIGSTYIGHITKKVSGDLVSGVEDKFQIENKWARGALNVTGASLNSFASGEANLMVSDIIEGEETFADKQLGLAETAIFVAASKTLTVKKDLETKDLKADLKLDPDNTELQKKLDLSEASSKQQGRYVKLTKDLTKTVYDKTKD